MSMLKTVAPTEAQGKVKQIYGMFEQLDMPVPLPLQMLSVSPEYLAIQGDLINYFTNHPKLSPSLLAHIRLMVANEENFTYCIHLNTQLLKKFADLSDEQIAVVAKDCSKTALEPAERDLLLFVQKVIRDPALTSQADMQGLKEQGWNDRDIFDATLMGVNLLAAGILFKAFKMGESPE